MNRPSAVVLLAVICVTTSLAGGVAGETRGTNALVSQQEFDSTEFHVTVSEDGDARWSFMYKKTLNDSNRQAFETYADQFNENETETYLTFQDRARALATSGTNATGREMTASNFSKRAYVTNLGNRGIVEMSFTWTNFAATDGDRVVVGDVFEGGLYVGPNQRLVVEQEPTLSRESIAPDPDARSNDSLTWEGEREFSDNRPRIVYVPEGTTGGVSPGGDETPGGDDTQQPEGGLGTPTSVALVLLVLAAGGVGLAWRYGLVGSRGGGQSPAPETGGPHPAGNPSEDSTAQEPTSDPADTPPAVTDEDLMTDESRVKNLLEEHGGRMKQVNIVEETGWSKSKVSMVLSDMEEEGAIAKLRIGRENVISLPGHEPDGVGTRDRDSDGPD